MGGFKESLSVCHAYHEGANRIREATSLCEYRD